MRFLIAEVLRRNQEDNKLVIYGPIEWQVCKNILDWQLF